LEALKRMEEGLKRRHELAKGWKGKGVRVVGWISSYTPEEIIKASGALPVRVLGALGATPYADVYLPTNMCPYLRSCFNLAKTYSYLDGLVVSNACDSLGKMFDVWRYHAGTPYTWMINTPHTNTEDAQSFFLEELERFKDSLSSFLKVEVNEDSLIDAIRVYNETRRLLKELYELRRMNPPPIYGGEALEAVLYSSIAPKEEVNELLKLLVGGVKEAQGRVKEGVRILISGSIMDSKEIVDVVETSGGVVVADDICTGSRYFWEPVEEGGNPLKSIAKRYLNRAPSAFMMNSYDRFNFTKDMIKRFNVDAVIIFTLKFCDPYLMDAPILMEELKAEGIPALHLEWDETSPALAGLKTRVEAFIEMVKG